VSFFIKSSTATNDTFELTVSILIGLNLSDLVFLEDGNPDILPEGMLVNFSKMRMCANIIIELQQYQQTPYCLHPVPLIQEYLSKLQVLSDKDLYKESLLREKGNRKA